MLSSHQKQEIVNKKYIDNILNDISNELVNRISDWISKGSGWVIESVNLHKITIIKYVPLRGSSYLPLPSGIKDKKGFININNEKDSECFRWCHLDYLLPVEKHPLRITKYKKHVNKVNYDNISFPVKLKDIPKIEEQNEIRFNVFGAEWKTIYPLYISEKVCEKTCNLLLIEGSVDGETVSQYVWINDFNKFMSTQTKSKLSKFFCFYCLQHFTTKDILERHKEVCLKINGVQRVKMPSNDKKIFHLLIIAIN